jgi:hypothetical protein
MPVPEIIEELFSARYEFQTGVFEDSQAEQEHLPSSVNLSRRLWHLFGPLWLRGRKRSIDRSEIEGAAKPDRNLVCFLDLPVDHGPARAGIDQETVKS